MISGMLTPCRPCSRNSRAAEATTACRCFSASVREAFGIRRRIYYGHNLTASRLEERGDARQRGNSADDKAETGIGDGAFWTSADALSITAVQGSRSATIAVVGGSPAL